MSDFRIKMTVGRPVKVGILNFDCAFTSPGKTLESKKTRGLKMKKVVLVVVRIMIFIGLFNRKFRNTYKSRNITKDLEPQSSKSLSETSVKALIWSVLLLAFSFVVSNSFASCLISFSKYNEKDDLTDLSNTVWNMLWFAMNNSVPLWFLINASEVSNILTKTYTLSKHFKLDVTWTSNYISIYLLNFLMGFITTFTDMYLNSEYTLGSDIFSTLQKAFPLLWFQYYVLDVTTLLFFWMITHALTETFVSVCQDVADLTNSDKPKCFRRDVKSMILSGEFEGQILDIYAGLQDLMDFIGCICLIRCIYDMVSTTVTLFFFISFVDKTNSKAISMLLAFLKRALGIFALSSSADNFNKKVGLIIYNSF